MKRCAFCAEEIEDSAAACPFCGKRQGSTAPSAATTSSPVASPDRAPAAGEMVVTTGDLRQEYDVIGPVYFQVSNKGMFSSALSKLVKQYADEMRQMKARGQLSEHRSDWGFLYGEWSVGQTDFEKAFFVAVQEIKKRAALLGADAVIGMRQDIDLDTNAFQFFYLQMYGTAVRIRRS